MSVDKLGVVLDAMVLLQATANESYINLAVAAGADYIVSRDNDLLDLMTGHTTECKEFRQRFRPLKVIDPVSFLKTLNK